MDSLRNGRGIWKVRAMPRWQIRSGVSPPISSPRKRMEPAVGGSAPDTQLKSVVFPEPLGPIKPRISPSRTSKDTWLSAVNPPKRLVIPVTVSTLRARMPDASERRLRRRDRIRGGRLGGGLDGPLRWNQRTASGEDAGSGRRGWAVATVLGNTSSNLLSMISKAAGNERRFWPAKRWPGGLNLTP